MISIPAKVISDWSKPLLEGGLGPGSSSKYLARVLLESAAQRYKIDSEQTLRAAHRPAAKTAAPWSKPTGGSTYRVSRDSRFFAQLLQESKSESYRDWMLSYMSAVTCPACRGQRLRPESRRSRSLPYPSPTSPRSP